MAARISGKQMEQFIYGVFALLGEENEDVLDVAMATLGPDGIDADPELDGLPLNSLMWQTFEEGGYLGSNPGVAVKLGDEEFQISIVRC